MTPYTGIMNEILPCIVCDKEFESPVGKRNESNLPWQGVIFYSQGNYGSQIWDSLFGKVELQINVCDSCLRTAASNDKVYVVKESVERTLHTEHWNPSRTYEG